MYLGKPTKRKNMTFAALCFLIAGFALYSWLTFDGIPPRSALQSASGKVSWMQKDKYGIKFGLTGVSKSFTYASKGNAIGLVSETLSRSDDPVITVLYDPNDPSGPVFSKDTYYSVFELGVGGTLFRSHAEIAEGWQSDQNLAMWLAACFALIGLYLARASGRSRSAT